jgi:tetratricopeptide (TPR) repeat protein
MATYCSAVTAEDPHAWTLQNNLGIILKRQGSFAAAEACFHQALEDNPGYIEAHVNLANAFNAAGNYVKAEAELQRAARMYAEQGRYAQAEPYFRSAAALAPGDFATRFQLCQVLLAEGKNEEALQVCAEVEQLAHKTGDPRAIDAAAKLRHQCQATPASR